MTMTTTGGHAPAAPTPTPDTGTPAPCTGPTTVPRWTLAPVPGTAEQVVTLPDELTTALRRRARELGVPLTAVLLAAHAKVLALLSGDRAVRGGYLPRAGTGPLPWTLSVGPGSWRRLVAAARRAEETALSSPTPGRHAPPPEVVLAPTGPAPAAPTGPAPAVSTGPAPAVPTGPAPAVPTGPAPAAPADGTAPTHGTTPADGAVLAVTVGEEHGTRVLRLRHRTDVLDAGSAARIGGYHLAALERIAADPDAPHDGTCLLSREEIRFQTEELAGPCRELPDRRVHELFEERVRRHPDAVAVEHRGRRWTYRELDVRANRLARALLAEGLRPEDTVAVVTERDLHWTAAVLAVLKAGGAYLPVDPHYPPGRMTAMLTRAGCALVLTEPGSTAHLDRALTSLPATRALSVPDLTEGAGDGTPLGLRVAADRLAYVFFTSGSTGEPKGAMCEHAGLLNHLHAKIEDLDIREGTVVAQTASQCFDISLWQLLAGLLTGGRTLLVEQAAILDADRFLDTLAEGRVNVLQVVPSYLDVLLTALERAPRALPDLRCVSVTGEALRTELVQRWFDGGPGVRLVNAYGLTETSDDTHHEVMDEMPGTPRIPLGCPLPNVRVHVVDDHLAPVPLGAPGALVFSGVCVGRGYVNDPERTRAAYLTDPDRPGQRLYQSGDFGRWLPDGKMEFLGRRDAQVKIRGFRVEIGEVENALLRVPGVHDGAVVVTGPEGHGRQLAAFCTADPALTADHLRERLGDLLPAYMVPASFHRLEELPLTANGKTDRKALTALAEGLGTAQETHLPPRTPTERRLAAAWAAVLGTEPERIGRGDDFFALGGTSLSAVRLAVRLDRAISLRDLDRHPALADLARLLDARSGTGPAVPPAES